MSMKVIIGLVGTSILAAILLVSALQSNCSAGLPLGLLDQTGCCKRCPACDHVCKFDAKEGEVEKPGFEVESKVICIPRVVFPWQHRSTCGSCKSCDGSGCNSCSSGVNNGAKTRRICVLKSEKYTCPECQYSWSAEKKPCGGCSDSGCACQCDSSPFFGETATVPQPTSDIGYAHPHVSEMESVFVHPPVTTAKLPTSDR